MSKDRVLYMEDLTEVNACEGAPCAGLQEALSGCSVIQKGCCPRDKFDFKADEVLDGLWNVASMHFHFY